MQEPTNQIQLTDRFAPIATVETTNTKQRMKNMPKWDNIWSPSTVVLATPPPTNTLAITHTPTPMIVQNFGIPTSGQQYSSSGASPPEAAVEATPGTTPLRDFGRQQRPFPVNSSAARTIWGNSSQPSSPLKREDFRYPDNS